MAQAGLVMSLALTALLRDRFQFLCNLAMIVGIVVPLLTVLGAKNGAVSDLLGRLAADPGLLTIETEGNDHLTTDQLDQVAALPGVVFVAPQSRSQTNWVLVRAEPGGDIQNARMIATGPGDPLLRGLAEPATGAVALSAELAERLGLGPGVTVEIVTDAPGRPRQGRAVVRVSAVLPEGRIEGEQILIGPDFLEQLEAFSDGYAVPGLGIEDGYDPADRAVTYERVRISVATMTDVAPVRRQVETLLRRNTVSAANEIETTLRTVADLDAAFRLIAIVGFTGVAAALIGSQINDVRRIRKVLATLSLMGFHRRDLLLLPAVQSVATIGVGLFVSLAIFAPAAGLAERILNPGEAAAQTFVALRAVDLVAVVGAGAIIAVAASLFAGRQILAIDPATILREVT